MKKKFLREKLEAERNETMEKIVEKEVEEIKEPKAKGRKKKND